MIFIFDSFCKWLPGCLVAMDVYNTDVLMHVLGGENTLTAFRFMTLVADPTNDNLSHEGGIQLVLSFCLNMIEKKLAPGCSTCDSVKTQTLEGLDRVRRVWYRIGGDKVPVLYDSIRLSDVPEDQMIREHKSFSKKEACDFWRRCLRILESVTFH